MTREWTWSTLAASGQTPVWIDVLTAVGTVAAVVAALYISVYRERRRAPRLSIDLSSGGLMGYALGEEDHGNTSGVLTLAVRNAPGRRTAEDVQVLLTVWQPKGGPFLQRYRLVTGRRLPWWYGDGTQLGLDAVTQEAVGPGMSRHVALVMVGHPKLLHERLGLSPSWDEMDEADRGFWREHRHGVWVVSPMDTGSATWLKIGASMEFAVTLCARDVDARTFHSRLTLHHQPMGAGPPGFGILSPEFAVFSQAGGAPVRLGVRHAVPCPRHDCRARNWPWVSECWRCHDELRD